MKRFSHWLSTVSLMLVVGTVVALAGCSSNVKSESVAQAKAADSFDMTVQSYKSGQFLLDGAILSSLDLNSHFAYLRDQGELPKTVLLERSDDSRIRKDHLRYMASMAYNYGFTVYYDDDGELRQIVPTSNDKATRLRGSPNPTNKKGNPHVERNSAAHSGTRPDYGY